MCKLLIANFHLSSSNYGEKNDKTLCIRDVNELSLLSKLTQGHFVIPINIITKSIGGTIEVIPTCTSGKLGVMLSGDENALDEAEG
jgi:hypothetical protein